MGSHYRTSRSSSSGDSTGYTFFRERRRRPKIEISRAHNGGRLGFQVIVRRSGIGRPYVECNGTEYLFEKQNHDGENVLLQEDTPYFVYPFGINQDPNKGAYIIQRDRKHREVGKFDDMDTIHASIRISGDGFKIEKDYNLKTNLSELRTQGLNSDELAERVTLSLEEIKEPSLWRRFLSSFGVTRSRIPK